MTDREKVINQLDVDIQRAERTGEMLVHVGRKTAKDALTLLKEQQEDIEDLMQLLKFPDLWEKYKNQPNIVMCNDCLLKSETDDEYMLVKCANGEWHDCYWFCADGKTNS